MSEENDYMAWHHDAARRGKLGQRQKRCKKCGLWKWRNERCEAGVHFVARKRKAAK